MRWKACTLFLNPTADALPKQTYGLKTRKCPPQVEELKPCENDLFSMIENFRFGRVNDQLLNTFKNDINNIKASDKVVVPADKTRNMYKMDKDVYNKLLGENITKSYKKADEKHLHEIHSEWRQISTEFNIADRIKITAEKQAYITLKDHKDNFVSRRTCRLLNPTKSNLERHPLLCSTFSTFIGQFQSRYFKKPSILLAIILQLVTKIRKSSYTVGDLFCLTTVRHT